MTFAVPPTIVRFSIPHQLASDTRDWLEHDLQRFFPGTRLVAVYEDHCDWEGVLSSEIWNERQIWFLDRYRDHVKVILNSSDPRLDTDIYNVGLLMSPMLLQEISLRDFMYEHLQVGEVFRGPFHGLGFWSRVIERDLVNNVLLSLPTPPPVSYSDGICCEDGIPHFLYRRPSRLHYQSGQIEYWCQGCWKRSYSMEGVTEIPLADLAESQTCVMCNRDFCVDDAHAPEWAAYPYRFRWRRPHATSHRNAGIWILSCPQK